MYETHADERTLTRWRAEFTRLIPVLTGIIESYLRPPARSSVLFASNHPLLRLGNALCLFLKEAVPEGFRLSCALALFSHPVCLGWP